MKRSIIFFLLVGFATSSAFGQFDFYETTGPPYYWNDTTNWSTASLPDGTAEVQIRNSRTCTLASNQTWANQTSTRTRVYGGATLNILSGGTLNGPGWFRVGASDAGTVNQTGGVLEVRYGNDNSRLVLGDAGGSNGLYNISDGTMTYNKTDSGQGWLIIGDRGGVGKLAITGALPTIDMGRLSVGGREAGRGATGTLEFNLTSSVSPIMVGYTILDPDGATSTANLIVNASVAPTAPVVLVMNSSATAVSGAFDSVTLTGLGAYTTLVYDYDADGTANDIALIPEPATLVLLGLGSLIAVRRRKK
jgi:hypothetical protein